ncbi:BPTI/Kunitz inhibitor domain-containing protein [Aphelenchoides bicaudatus]|nr:BPTI/Kunitz inhibitor domain-containing protein [Aphelenchoides bicaudatus]
MIRDCLISFLFIWCLVATAHSNPLPGPPIFYKTSTYPAVCYLPPDSGACDTNESQLKEGKDAVEQKQETRYYFDTVTEECYPFAFFIRKPCSQNNNNFKTLEACKLYCKIDNV